MGKERLSKKIKLCGVIFINEHQFLVFHCALCDDIFDTWEGLQEHFINHFDKISVKTSVIDGDLLKDCEITTTELSMGYQNYDDDVQIEIVKGIENEGILHEQILVQDYTGDISSETNVIEVSLDDINLEDQLDNNIQQNCNNLIDADHSMELSVEKNVVKDVENVEQITENETINQLTTIKKSEIQSASNVPRRKYRRDYDDAVRKHKCEYCGFAFKDSSNLANHVRRHSGVKEYACSFCPKEFYTRSELKAHERHHTGEQPFLCTVCGKRFFNSGALYGHTKRHENRRLHKCDKCGKSFYDDRGLQDHKVIHSNERNVRCPQCPSTFKLKKTLSAHMKIHLNKREHRCHLCSASFNQRPGLISHLKATHRIAEEKVVKK